MQLRPVKLLKGLATFVPGVAKLACRSSGGTDSPRYCYAVWLLHLIRASRAGLGESFETVAEVGPGDTIGVGLAAVLTGTRHYVALDAIAHARTRQNLEMFDALLCLFLQRQKIPDKDEFPELFPSIEKEQFPSAILNENRLRAALRPDRIAAIRAAIQGQPSDDDIAITYVAPWQHSSAVPAGSLDLLFSQAVLEHVEDVAGAYQSFYRWLRPGGAMSHTIDFRSHGLTRDWYGHWTIPEWQWKLVHGRRPYLLNRLPASWHCEMALRAGFQIVGDHRLFREAASSRALADRFRDLGQDDLRTASMFLQAIKPTDRS